MGKLRGIGHSQIRLPPDSLIGSRSDFCQLGACGRILLVFAYTLGMSLELPGGPWTV
jgi:hypothetical protein